MNSPGRACANCRQAAGDAPAAPLECAIFPAARRAILAKIYNAGLWKFPDNFRGMRYDKDGHDLDAPVRAGAAKNIIHANRIRRSHERHLCQKRDRKSVV